MNFHKKKLRAPNIVVSMYREKHQPHPRKQSHCACTQQLDTWTPRRTHFVMFCTVCQCRLRSTKELRNLRMSLMRCQKQRNPTVPLLIEPGRLEAEPPSKLEAEPPSKSEAQQPVSSQFRGTTAQRRVASGTGRPGRGQGPVHGP